MHRNRTAATLLTALLATTSAATSAQPQDGAPAAPSAPAPVTAPATAPAAAMEYAVLRTNRGDIVIELNREKAPVTVENFVGYAKEGFYDGTVFHRVVPNFVIQGGGFERSGAQKKTKAPIMNEWRNGLKNRRGTLSMARTPAPDSATSQFFISLKDNESLDQPISGGAGYAVFARVIAGMEIVDAIAGLPTSTRNGMANWPNDNVVMLKVEMITKEEADKLAKPAAADAPPASPPPASPPPTSPPPAAAPK